MNPEPGVVVKKAQYVTGPKQNKTVSNLIDFGPEQPKNEKQFDDLFSFEEEKNDITNKQLESFPFEVPVQTMNEGFNFDFGPVHQPLSTHTPTPVQFDFDFGKPAEVKQ